MRYSRRVLEWARPVAAGVVHFSSLLFSSLLFSSLLFSSDLLTAQAPGGVHPHVGPLAPGAVIQATSPAMNIPEGAFNLGEAPAGSNPNGSYLDTGGFLGIDTTPLVLGSHVHTYVDASGSYWFHDPNPPYDGLERFRGYLSCAALIGPSAPR